ncbi:IclR family transcriptional regulator [Halosimplex rubrum]|uniref:IclR family transcriptional regulator n=1 Tax=Halosimplex rubrum TaxID=869889 RepID=A0A7D5TDR5_9EURY|nr:IclR family transcriptional regulator [Halosimplex rubrum]QLH78436.1 IclR family transcriptional regulator [Halosimplex rubrum]
MDRPGHHVKSDVTAFRIIQALEQSEKMGVSDITKKTGIAKSSVYKHLDTLRALGFITKEGTTYSLSLRWLEIGNGILKQRSVYEIARPEVDRLSQLTGETVSLVVEEEGDAVYLEQTQTDGDTAGPIAKGERLPVSASAAGKAILSYRPESEVKGLLAETEFVDEVDQLFSELRALRNQRLVIERDTRQQDTLSAGAFEGHRHEGDHREPYRELNSIAVPIRNADNYAVAAIELSGPQATLYGRRLEEEVTSLLVNTAKSIETSLVQRAED